MTCLPASRLIRECLPLASLDASYLRYCDLGQMPSGASVVLSRRSFRPARSKQGRIRNYLNNPNFPRIIAAWKFSYSQIRIHKIIQMAAEGS